MPPFPFIEYVDLPNRAYSHLIMLISCPCYIWDSWNPNLFNNNSYYLIIHENFFLSIHVKHLDKFNLLKWSSNTMNIMFNETGFKLKTLMWIFSFHLNSLIQVPHIGIKIQLLHARFKTIKASYYKGIECSIISLSSIFSIK